ncbi:MAG TPA: Holliday junction resolvase RuvX [Acidimicrobiales bacterium]|nr:Holliday junction resolvase RuvX [Acidimicrobiales bacterium]
MRALGIDPGTVRVGLALSDPEGRLASPYEVLERTRDRPRLVRDIARIVAEEEVEVVVVGYPLSLDGSEGPAARSAVDEARAVAAAVAVPVVLHDERFTTVTAHRLLAEAGLDERARRRVVDRAAAAVLLQAWLDGGCPMTRRVAPPGDAEE